MPVRSALVIALGLVTGVAACSKPKPAYTAAATTDRAGATGASEHRDTGTAKVTVTPAGGGAASSAFGPVLFEFDATTLSPSARAELQRLADAMAGSTARVTIEGHADDRGTTEYNLALGQQRADVIATYLATLGVAADRIKTITYGEERPAAAGDDEQAWAQNRRGELRPDR